MSSKKKKNKKRQPNRTTEKLVQQVNTNDEPLSPEERATVLEEYERKIEDGRRRKEERQRLAEEGAKERARPKSGSAPEPPEPEEGFISEPAAAPLPADIPAPVPLPLSPAPDDRDSDVKTFEIKPKEPEVIQSDEQDFATEVTQALSENYDEMVPEEEPPQPAEETAAPAKRPNKFFLVFGVFIIIMSVIGIVSSASFIAGVVSDIANQTDLKNDIALFLYPLVTVDPPDCDSVDELPPTIITEAAIWRIILTGDNTNYEKLYNTYMYVPAVDVEFSVRSIFGNSVDIVHQTVGTMDITFTYVEEQNSYLVPIDPHYTAYSPRITDIKNVGELYTVTVDYIPPSALAVEGIDLEVTPAKTIVYVLSKSRNSATVHSIKNVTSLGNVYEY